jgi:hypothetical protein
MARFALHLKPMNGTGDWSYTVRNHVGAVVAESHFLPNRVTAELIGQAQIRRLSGRFGKLHRLMPD